MYSTHVKEIVEEILQALLVPFESVAIEDEDSHPLCVVRTPEAQMLIGNNGERLDALNYLVRKIIEKRFGKDEAHILIDIGGYHRRKIESVKAAAMLLANRARTFQHDVEMSPMNAYERMVVHTLFADDPEITTQSQGEGKFRHVVLRYHTKVAGDSTVRL